MENLQLGANDLKSIFDSVDTDGNGLIEINELYTALKEANGKEFNPETCQLLMGKDGNVLRCENICLFSCCSILAVLNFI